MKNLLVIILIFISILTINADNYRIYKLKKGETLWRVSQTYGVNLDEILKLNQIHDVTKVSTGYSLKIPVNKTTENNISNLNLQSSFGIHELKKGETIWRISKKYGISVNELCKINSIKDHTKVKIGTRLKVPANYNYLDYNLPLDGEITLFKTSHFSGVHIFIERDSNREVSAVDNGEVSYIDSIPGYGLTVFIKHKNGLLSTYSGLETINVKAGDKITQNQKIGLAGNLARYDKYGILFSIQNNGKGLRYDTNTNKFIISAG